MTLTKLKSFVTGEFEYVNLEAVEWIDTLDDKFEIYMQSGHTMNVDLTDTTVAALIAAADA